MMRFAFSFFLFSLASTAVGQSRYLLQVAQPDVNHRTQRTYLQPLEFGRALTAVLLQDRSAIELLVVDGCEAVLRRGHIRTIGLSDLFGLECMPDGALLMGAQLVDNAGFALLKTTIDGEVIWAYRYELPPPVVFHSVAVNNQGEIWVSGTSSTIGEGYLVKIDPTGEVLWARRVKVPALYTSACAASDGGSLHVGDNYVWKWSATGSIVWHAQLLTKGNLVPGRVRPVGVSDGYVLGVRLEDADLHLVKVSHTGQLRWFQPTGIPTYGLSTYTLVNRSHLEKLLPYRGDTLLVVGLAPNQWMALHLISPEGNVLTQRFYWDHPSLQVQDFGTANGRVYAAGWQGPQIFVMGVQGDMRLACADTTALLNTTVLGRISLRPEPLPTVEAAAIARTPINASFQEKDVPLSAYRCLTNDSTGIADVVRIRPPPASAK